MTQSTFPQAEICWQAILKRDNAYDGLFYYGVRSTGIYCKPSCSSRQPRPDQVTYFLDQTTAEEAGFRACKRCQPKAQISAVDALVEKALTHLDQATEPLTLHELSTLLGVSPYHLQRVFKAHTGLSPRQYAAARRLEKFKKVAQTSSDVTSAQYNAGYGSTRSLYQQAARELGMTPAAYRRGGHGMVIHYAFIASRLGQILVAATERGLCAVRLGDERQSLETDLISEFPAAQCVPTTDGLERWLQMLQAYLEGEPLPGEVTLDTHATPFQLRVWEALRRIPYGQTTSYSQVAAAIGQPSAVRAVAQACAANPAALITPCHRVVRSDGSLGGYRWGVERKQMILAQEKSH